MDFRRHGLVCAALLEASAALAGSVSGRLLDSSGKPVEGAAVVWFPFRSEEETLLDETTGREPQPLGETKTDVAGRFAARWEKALGPVSVRVLSPSHPDVLLPGPYDASQDTELPDIALPSSRRIAGSVVDEAGKPVAGARVEVTSGEVFAFTLAEEGGRYLCRAVANATGGFVLVAAPEGRLGVSVRAAGFVPDGDYWTDPKSAPTLKLKRGATLRGTVAQSDGKPAAGALVIAGSVAARSDESGQYVLPDVAPGPARVRATWRDEFFGEKKGFRVRKGEEAEANIRLARGLAISGTVVEKASRKPLPGTEISAMGRSEETRRKAWTDSQGRFRIAGLSPGTYRLDASLKDYLPASGISVETSSPEAKVALALSRAAAILGRVRDEMGEPVAGARVGVAVRFGPIVATGPDGSFHLRGLEPSRGLSIEATKRGYAPARSALLSLRPGQILRNVSLVTKRGLAASGRIVNEQGEGIGGAEVRLERRPPEGGGYSSDMWEGAPDAASAPDGSYSLTGLEKGEYTARVKREGYSGKTVASLPVEAGEANVWAPIVLAPSVAIAGTVRNRQGDPIPAPQVLVFSSDEVSRRASSGADGRFRIDGLSSGQMVSLTILAEGYAEETRQLTAPNEELLLVLSRGGTLRGRVEDFDSRRPISRFTVSVAAATGLGVSVGRPMLFEGEDGSFELTGIPGGKWKLRAWADGYRIAEIGGVEVAEESTQEGLVIRLGKGVRLTGRVLDARRRAGVPNASVVWRPAKRGFEDFHLSERRETATDANGNFQFDGLAPERIVVTTSHPEHTEAMSEIALDSPSSFLEVVLKAGGEVSGNVLAKDGSPLSGVTVLLTEREETSFSLQDGEVTDSAGRFLFSRVRPGAYSLSTGGATAKPVEVAEDERVEGIVLQLRSGTLLRGRVVGLPMGQLGGVEISSHAQESSQNNYRDETTTDDVGQFLFRDVPPGRIRIEARKRRSPNRSAGTVVEVADAAEQEVEVLFKGISRLSGRVLRGEEPIAGVYVSAAPHPSRIAGSRSLGQTDSAGRFSVEGLEDGEHLVSVVSGRLIYRKIVKVSGDTDADIPLPGGSIRGRVTDAISGESIESADIERAAGPARTGGDVRSSTDSNGSYSMEYVDPGTYRLTVRKEGYKSQEHVVPVGGGAAEVNISLQRSVP